MKRAFIIHGWDGVPDNSWKPWLKKELKKKGFEVIAPQMSGGRYPKVKDWLSTISEVVGKPQKEDYFVGHSLGCIAICKYLETLKDDVKIGGCVFVAGFHLDLGIPEISEFSNPPPNIQKVKKHTDNFVVIQSDNDEYVSLDKSQAFQKILGAEFILEKGKGHLSEKDKIKELPSLLNAILEMSK